VKKWSMAIVLPFFRGFFGSPAVSLRIEALET
jgi:hypothetical protein